MRDQWAELWGGSARIWKESGVDGLPDKDGEGGDRERERENDSEKEGDGKGIDGERGE